jgi:hypothetical protein
MYELLCCGRNQHLQFFWAEGEKHLPFFLFTSKHFSLKTKRLHTPRSFIWDEASLYSTKHFVTIERHLFCFLSTPVLHVMMMILWMSNECLYECKNDVMRHANVCHKHKQNHTQTLHPLRNDLSFFTSDLGGILALHSLRNDFWASELNLHSLRNDFWASELTLRSLRNDFVASSPFT